MKIIMKNQDDAEEDENLLDYNWPVQDYKVDYWWFDKSINDIDVWII